MEYIGTIFGIIIAIIVIVSWIKSLNPTGSSSLQSILNRGLANVLGEQNNFDDSIKIYDENGNVINFQNNTVANNNTQDVIIYDEDGNVMSANSPPVPVYENKKVSETKVSQEYEIEVDEAEAHADMYHDFIRSNGGSAIVVQEILGKPAALRNN
ncbi:MAG: hypothetical protein KAS17_04540 [Victivallaceae bacterium]|nr:hypothetical protein [Victivallaceae bacterium]